MAQVTREKKKTYLLVWLLILMITCSCSTNRQKYTFLKNDNFSNYVFIEYYNGLRNLEVNIINQKPEKNLYKSFRLKSDVSYNYFDYEANQVFLFGPGGMIRIDIENQNIVQQTDINTSHVFKIEDSYATVSNLGYTNNEGGYLSRINLQLHEPFTFDVEYAINSIQYHDGNLYISNMQSDNQEYFVDTYSLQGDYIDRKYYDDFGLIKIFDGVIAYVTQEYYQIADQKIKFDSPLFSIYDEVALINDKISMFAYDYNKGQCSFSYKNEHTVFENCIGYHKVDDYRYIVKTKKDVIVFDSNDKSEIKTPIVNNESIYYDMFLY